MKLLRDIALVRAGVAFRRKVEAVPNGPYRVVQIKDVDRDRGLQVGSLMRVDAPEVRDHHLLLVGDVLFVARGNRNFAVVFHGPMDNAVAGSQFFVVRPTTSVLPEYLAWFLNEESAQRHFAEYASGSLVPFVTRVALDEVEVLLPSLEDQRRIAAIHELSLKEQELLDSIKAKRRHVSETLLRAVLARVGCCERLVKQYS